MDWNPNLIYELISHLDLATIKRICASDQRFQRICQEDRVKTIIQQKRVDQLFNRIGYDKGIDYIVDPIGKHNISISFEQITERNIGYADKEEISKKSILFNTIGRKNLGYDLHYVIIGLGDPTDVQIRKVLNAIINLPNFDPKRISYWLN